jgi:PqqD family protein of HPr-rel-A system
MTGKPLHYRAEASDARIILPLDALTLIYQRRSGITHIVTEPVPQILEAMGCDMCDVRMVLTQLSQQFDLGDDAHDVVAARLEELASLGLVERIDA